MYSWNFAVAFLLIWSRRPRQDFLITAVVQEILKVENEDFLKIFVFKHSWFLIFNISKTNQNIKNSWSTLLEHTNVNSAAKFQEYIFQNEWPIQFGNLFFWNGSHLGFHVPAQRSFFEKKKRCYHEWNFYLFWKNLVTWISVKQFSIQWKPVHAKWWKTEKSFHKIFKCKSK